MPKEVCSVVGRADVKRTVGRGGVGGEKEENARKSKRDRREMPK